MESKKTVIYSVGLNPSPIIFSINDLKPDQVIFYCSNDTAFIVNEVYQKCPFLPYTTPIITKDVENIYKNVELLMAEFKERNINNWNNVFVDFTGGTKAMSVALVLTTIDKGVKYVYISSDQRVRDAQGFVIDGKEKLVQTENPWDSIAFLQRSEVCMAFNMLRYDEAISFAKKASHNLDDNNSWRLIFTALIDIFEGYKNWDLFQHYRASQGINKGLFVLKQHACYNDNINRFVQEVVNNYEFLSRYKSNDPAIRGRFYIEDLISNAYRRGEIEKKYDDAVARLYRAVELIAQEELKHKFSIDASNCQEEQIPDSLKDTFKNSFVSEKNCYKLGLQNCYLLLNELGSELGMYFIKRFNEYRRIMDTRNSSILAHGLNPIEEKDYRSLLEFVIELCNLTEDKIVKFPKLTL